MPHLFDGQVFHYGGFQAYGATAVGWLSADREFPVAAEQLGDRFIAALKTGCAEHRVRIMRGYHTCEFCPPPPLPSGKPPFIRHTPVRPEDPFGNGEVWVKGSDGLVFVAPALVYHYVVEHHYAPPSAFLDAVVRGQFVGPPDVQATAY